MVNFGKKIKYFLIYPKFYTLHFTLISVIPTEGSESFRFFLSFFLPFPFLVSFSSFRFPVFPSCGTFHVRLNCSARRIRFQVINNMWATAPRNLYFAGPKPPKYRKFRQSYQHFIVEILIFVEKCVTIDV